MDTKLDNYRKNDSLESKNEFNKKQISKEEKYLKLIASCLISYKDKLSIAHRSLENDTLKIFVQKISTGDIELIHLKNISFYSVDELIDILLEKFNKIVKNK